MKHLPLIMTSIKQASIATKIGLAVGATTIVAGSTTGICVIASHTNHASTNNEVAEEQSASNDSNDTTSSDTKDAQNTKEDDQQPTTENDTHSQKKETESVRNVTSNTNNSVTNNNTGSPAASQSAKKPDYNLNDKYVAGNVTVYFSSYNAGECVQAEEKSFFGIAKFQGTSSDLWNASISRQYADYARLKGYDTEHCGGMGGYTMTWQDAINEGIALDEAKCAQYGLSCGRW